MTPSKNMDLSMPGNLKTNSFNNTSQLPSIFAADFVRVGIKTAKPAREVWIRIKQNVAGKNYKVNK